MKERMEGSESAQLAVAVDQLKRQVIEAEEQADAAKAKKQELITTAKVRLRVPSFTLSHFHILL